MSRGRMGREVKSVSNGEQLQAVINEAIRAVQSLTVCLQGVAAVLGQSSPEHTAAPDPGAHAPDRPITIETIRNAMSVKRSEGKIHQIRELLLKYDAGRLSEVKAEDYASLLRELEAL